MNHFRNFMQITQKGLGKKMLDKLQTKQSTFKCPVCEKTYTECKYIKCNQKIIEKICFECQTRRKTQFECQTRRKTQKPGGRKPMNRKHFKCKCGCNKRIIIDTEIEKLFNYLELCHGKGLVISGNRCETHNRNQGGVAESLHIPGLAGDFAFYAGSNQDWAASVIRYRKSTGLKFQFTLYAPGKIHIELDERT